MSFPFQFSPAFTPTEHPHSRFEGLQDCQDTGDISYPYFPSGSTTKPTGNSPMCWQEQNKSTFPSLKWSHSPVCDSAGLTSSGVDPRNINPMLSGYSSGNMADHDFSHITDCVSGTYTQHRNHHTEAPDPFHELLCDGSPHSYIDRPSSSNGSIDSGDLPDSFNYGSHTDRTCFPRPTIEGKTPYNKLLFKCLADAPNYELSLRDIYAWFRENTGKGSLPHSSGWQNSIRHNLSMNQAFRRGARSEKNRNVKNMWSLTEDALKNGIEPTTRYRRSEKSCARSHPANYENPFTSARDIRHSARLGDNKVVSSSAPVTPSHSLLGTPESQRWGSPISLQDISPASHVLHSPYYQSGTATSAPIPISMGEELEPRSLSSDGFFNASFQGSDIPLPNRHHNDMNSFQPTHHRHYHHPHHQSPYSNRVAMRRPEEPLFGTPPLTESSYSSPPFYHNMTSSVALPGNEQVLADAPWGDAGLQQYPNGQQQGCEEYDSSQLDPIFLGDPHNVLKAIPGAPLFYEADREEDEAFYPSDNERNNDVDEEFCLGALAENEMSSLGPAAFL